MPLSTAQWTIWLVGSIVYGLSIGSFLNVVIYRLPRGQSVASPMWSYCPNCEHRLAGADLIPLFSFLALGRRCRYCRKPISWRYFGVEALTGALFALIYLRFGPSIDCIFAALFVSLLVPAFFIDIECFIIPDEICVLGFALGLVYNLYGIWIDRPGMWFHLFGTRTAIPGAIGSAVICALIFHMIGFLGLLYYGRSGNNRSKGVAATAGAYWLGIADDYGYLLVKFLGFGLWLAPARRFIRSREIAIRDEMADADSAGPMAREEIAAQIEAEEDQTGMGQGDAKLAAMIGSFLLLPLSLVSFFLAVLAGTVGGVALMVAQSKGGKTAIPFGPYLAVGAVVSLLCGPSILGWYLHYAFPPPHAPSVLMSLALSRR